jgi:hypothetical protein
MTSSEEDSNLKKIGKHIVNSPLYVGYVLCKGVEKTCDGIAKVSDLVIEGCNLVTPIFVEIKIITQCLLPNSLRAFVDTFSNVLSKATDVAPSTKFLSEKLSSCFNWLSAKLKSWWW